jgi:hypothetical protein
MANTRFNRASRVHIGFNIRQLAFTASKVPRELLRKTWLVEESVLADEVELE